MTNNKPLKAWVSNKMHKEVERRAKRRGVSISEYIREAIEDRLSCNGFTRTSK